MAIDRNTILQNIYRGYGGLLDGQLTVRGSVGYNPTLRATPYSPDKAKELLTQAGYPNGLSLTYVVPMNYQIGDHEIALAIVAQLKKVGIDLKLNEMEFATYSVGRGRGTLRDMYMVAWYDLGDAENALVLYTKRGGFSVWDNPEFEGVMQKARTTTNPNARQQFLREANAIMNRELPASFLFQVPAIYGVSRNVVGWEPRRDELVGWLYKVVLK
jgi:peptide/nickel transport system substrate-binding protein